jgi:hypothetical protein
MPATGLSAGQFSCPSPFSSGGEPGWPCGTAQGKPGDSSSRWPGNWRCAEETGWIALDGGKLPLAGPLNEEARELAASSRDALLAPAGLRGARRRTIPPGTPTARLDRVAARDRGLAARRLGATPGQIALAWLLGRPAVSSVILGARTVARLEDNLGAADGRLDPGGPRSSTPPAPEIDYPYGGLAVGQRSRNIDGYYALHGTGER